METIQIIKPKYPNHIGMKIERFKLSKIQKIALIVMGINVIIPFTFWPITNPMIALIAIKLDKKNKVKFL